MNLITSAQDRIKLSVHGEPFRLEEVCTFCRQDRPKISIDSKIAERMQPAVELVAKAVESGESIYGVNTGFGGMVGVSIGKEDAADLQNNLLHFLAAGTGNYLPDHVVRTAMLLRANVLASGYSGVRFEIVQRLLRFIEANAIPCVREHGSIGASGDLVPLSVIGRAITGQGKVHVKLDNRIVTDSEVLDELNLEKLKLLPKEGLAIVNGTTFSAAVAAHAVFDGSNLLALSIAIHAMYAIALGAHDEPFSKFVQECKPHQGQQLIAETVLELLQSSPTLRPENSSRVQDRYSLRCLPQYLGPIAEDILRVRETVQIEMNSISDNPLIDPKEERFYQSGNFLGHGLSMAMDDFRRDMGLLAKHIDVQIALLVTPEFSNGLPSSLQGNEHTKYNMGLKGLQIVGNSLMPLLSWYGNPLVVHYPTHAEQYNQNINGLSWESANLARRSIETLQRYLAVASLFAVQALDLRARAETGRANGRELLGSELRSVYDAICDAIGHDPQGGEPYLDNDTDRWLENDLEELFKDLKQQNGVIEALLPIGQKLGMFFKSN